MLHIDVCDTGAVARLELWGHADPAGVGDLRRALKTVVYAGNHPVVEVDAAHLSMIDAQCLLTISVAEVAARLHGGQLRIVNASVAVAVACSDAGLPVFPAP
jgi:anti-anti-sigma regulatory factor